jgi:DNA-binding beta-propeller fold protein YncE
MTRGGKMRKNVLFVLVVAVVSVCSGQWFERQVILGDTFGGLGSPDRIVANPISGNVYVESRPIQVFNPATLEKMRGPGVSGSVVFCPPSGKGYVLREPLVIIDAAADTVTGTTMLPFGPNAYAYSRTSNRLYLAHRNDTNLLVYDPGVDSILGTVSVGFDIRALTWDTVWNRVYIGGASDTAAELRALDCVGDTLRPGIRTGLATVSSLTLSAVSHKLYCAGDGISEIGAVVAVSTDSMRCVDTVPGLPAADVISYSPVTDRLYVVDDEDVYVVDCRGDTIRAARDLVLDAYAITPSTLTGRVYVGIYDSAQVLMMDTTDSVVGTIRLPTTAAAEVDALTFSPDRDELYAATDNGHAFVVDASLDTIAGAVSYETVTAYQMIHNPAGNKLYVLCPDQDEVLVFDSTFDAPKHISGGVYNASGMPVLSPALNRMYVADGSRLRVIDCISDSLLGSRIMFGLSHSIPVMVPYLNKLYVFAGSSAGDSAYAYGCLRDTVFSVSYLTDAVPCAVYDPRSNRVFFACEDSPTVRALDPVTDSVVKTFNLVGGSYGGRMAVNLDLGRLYYTDQTADRMFTLDLQADSVIASESLPWDIEAMFLNRRLGKLYLCSQDTARVLVFDCGQGTVVDTIHAGYQYAGLMDDRNDKFYLRYGAVVDCRYDSVVTRLDSLSPRSMAWDAIDNRVFQATTSRLYVYRDELYGVADGSVAARPQRLPTIVRGVLRFEPVNGDERQARGALLDVTGRRVMDLRPGRNDVRSLPAGVYFVRQVVGNQTVKVVIQR